MFRKKNVKLANTGETVRKLIVANSISYLGIKEKPNNSGFYNARFQESMELTGWHTSWPWCASFVRMVYLTTLKELYGNNELYESVRNTLGHGVVATYNKLLTNHNFEVSRKPLGYGSIVLWRTHGNNGHMGIVLYSKTERTLTTVEGNTNSKGSREGEYVAIKDRPIKPKNWKVLCYAKIKDEKFK